MGRLGLGLKPLIAAYLVVVLGSSAGLVGLAATKLAGHALVGERVAAARTLLAEFHIHLDTICPDSRSDRLCPGLSEWTRDRTERHPELRSLSLVDSSGRVVASSDSSQGARGLWDALGQAEPKGSRGRGFWVVDDRDARVLVVEAAQTQRNLHLRGAFGLARTDAAATRVALWVVIYGALVSLAMLVIGWLLLHRLVVRPVERLLSEASRVSEQGDLSSLLAADSGSEFGRLGVSLSRMARRIKTDQLKLVEQIGELEGLNQDLQQAQQVMVRQEKLASVGLLAAGLAHEVGNPMSAIMGYVDMLRSEDFPPAEQDDILARVGRELERIDRIIQDLLAYSRPGPGESFACAPADLVEQALGLIRPQKKFKRITFAAELPKDLPQVLCDPDKICQVLVNLMFNALDAVADGGRLWVRASAVARDSAGGLDWGPAGEPSFFARGDLHRIRPPRDGRGLSTDRGAVVFSVVDDGQGINGSDLGRIFDPFFTTKPPGKGTGLGLAICHATIQSSGGEIWAWSQSGAGTQFAFWLPEAPDG